MDWRKLKWELVLGCFLGALAILLSAHYLWQRGAVERPLVMLLEQDRDVSVAVVSGEGKKAVVEVELKETARLRETVSRVEAIVKKAQPNIARIVYKDKSNAALDRVYHDLHFAVYEAARTGSYVALAERVDVLASGGSVSRYRVEVDATAIYVQLHAHDAYLYRVVPLGVTTR